MTVIKHLSPPPSHPPLPLKPFLSFSLFSGLSNSRPWAMVDHLFSPGSPCWMLCPQSQMALQPKFCLVCLVYCTLLTDLNDFKNTLTIFLSERYINLHALNLDVGHFPISMLINGSGCLSDVKPGNDCHLWTLHPSSSSFIKRHLTQLIAQFFSLSAGATLSMAFLDLNPPNAHWSILSDAM